MGIPDYPSRLILRHGVGMSREKLKPCPFCGVKPKVYEGWSATAVRYWGVLISCESKTCVVHPQLSAHSKDLYNEKNTLVRLVAVKTWNRRKQ